MASLGGPNIITNGLVLQLDAANAKSYVSGSATWRDLSGNNNTGSLGVSGSGTIPTYNNINGGVLTFNGNNNYVNLGSSPINFPTGNITVLSWCRVSAFNSTWNIIITKWFSTIGAPGGSFDFHFSIKNNGFTNRQNLYTTSNSDIYSTTPLFTNTWYNIGFTLVNGGLLQFYLNGIQDGSVSPVTRTYGSDSLIMGDSRSSLYALNGNVANSQIYNRALSASEIFQNYNATKGRFGL
jgi:hypothetical protein